jgi:hypothetical protein
MEKLQVPGMYIELQDYKKMQEFNLAQALTN